MAEMTKPAKGHKPRYTFSRGIHPDHAKELTEGKRIEVMPTPKEVKIPLIQHIGAPSKSVVKPRKPVEMGSVLAESGGFISAVAHASLSGKPSRESASTLPNGRHVNVIPLKVDPEQKLGGEGLYDAYFGGEWPLSEVSRYTPDEIADSAVAAGLVGMGGAAFPAHVKLRRNDKKPVEDLIINGCECEPYLTADYRLMMESPGSVVSGALLAQRANGAKRVMICLEDDTPDAGEKIREAARGTEIEVKLLKTKYPQGGEKQLVLAVTGRAVPTGGLPLDVGAVVMNVATVSALARMVMRGIPLTHRIVTVTGRGIREPKNVLAPIGISLADIVAFCGGLKEEAGRIVAGGPMMGFSVGDLNIPLTKGSSGITVLTHEDIRKEAETACIRCARCVDVCPLSLVPTKIALAARAERPDIAKRYHIMACMECGCCNYQCPASIPLVQLIRTGKIQLRKAS